MVGGDIPNVQFRFNRCLDIGRPMNLTLEFRFLAQFVTTARGPVIATMGDGFKMLAITREDLVS